MEWNWNIVFLSALISLISLVWQMRRKNSYRRSKLPPGPRGWPVIGNLFDIGSLPHRSLAALKQEYGPVVWLNLAAVKTMVLLSAGAAEELFKNHDLTFVDRFMTDTTRSHEYYKSSMVLGPYSLYWRTLKRICNVELFSNKRINETMLIRRKSVDSMLLWIEKEAEKCTSNGIKVKSFIFPALFNMIGNLTLSRDLVDPHSKISSEFCTALAGFHDCLVCPNISDLFPWLRWLDLQGLRRKMDRHLGKAIDIISVFVEERVEERQQMKQGISSEQRKDFLDVLLDYRGTGKDELPKLSHHQVTIFLMEMFIAGTDTVSTTLEWVMAELLQNPQVMVKVKAELARVIGTNKKLQENDIDNLPYLRATIEESLRLHPPAPILLPRRANKDISFMGYSIPKNTQVLVNNWAFARDEECWEDALSFKPERFLDSNVNYKGQNFEFIPFGSGRRMCPGLPLAHRLAPFILGSLFHHFEWELCEGQKTIDMRETIGATSKKLEPLKAIPKRMMTT